MTGGDLIQSAGGAKLPALPMGISSLEDIQSKRCFLEAWKNDNTLIPGVVRTQRVDRDFQRSVDQLAARRNTVLGLVILNNLAPRLAQDDFPLAVDRTCQWLAQHPLKVPPGLDLVGSLEENNDWIEVLFKKLELAKPFKAAPSEPIRGRSSATAPAPLRWLTEVQRPKTGNVPDFLRWWNQSIAIKALAAITAGIRTWDDFVEDVFDLERGVLGRGSWTKSYPLIPTSKTCDGRTVHAILHAHPQMCQLLAFGRPMDTKGSGTWAVKFRLTDLGGDSSQGKYRSATGLNVRHLYVATLLEHIRPEPRLLTPVQSRDKGILMPNPARTDAAEKARVEAIKRLIDATAPNGTSVRSARRFVQSAPAPARSTSLEAEVHPISAESLGFVAADDSYGEELACSIGSICIDSAKLNPEHGVFVVRLHATIARRGTHSVAIALHDDDANPDRVHLVVPDPSKLPGVASDAEGMALIHELRRTMLLAQWAMTIEPSCPDVINLGMAVAIMH